MMNRKAYTLIELAITSAIIVSLLVLLLPSATAMWRLMQMRTAKNRIRHILKVAQMESLSLRHSAYGVLFFLDQFNQQSMAYIRWSGIPEPHEQLTWPDIANRFDVDNTVALPEKLPHPWHVVPTTGLDRSAQELNNNFYRLGWHRNFFAVVFRRGLRSPYSPLIVRDRDHDADGDGDLINLPVGDVVQDSGVKLQTIVSNVQQQPVSFETEWGIWLYDDNTFSESPILSRSQHIHEHGVPLLMSHDASFVHN